MGKVYKTKKIKNQNIVSFTCSDDALEPVLEILNQLRILGSIGASRNIIVDWDKGKEKLIFFDGDGRDRVDNIVVNGLTLNQWNEEWKNNSESKPLNIDNNQEESKPQKQLYVEAITFEEFVAYVNENSNPNSRNIDYKGFPITKENDKSYLIPVPRGAGFERFTPEDVLIIGKLGQIYPCEIKIFEACYEKVEE